MWPTTLLALTCAVSSVGAQPAPDVTGDTGMAALQARQTALSAQLANNVFKRPLVLQSTDGDGTTSGDAYAVLDAPFSAVSTTFRNPGRWCEVLILHLNTKHCRADAASSPARIAVHMGRKKPQELTEASVLEFNYRLAASSPQYIAAQLNADKGPAGTSAYRIELQAIPAGDGKTFIHLRYAYAYTAASRMAMQVYLNTLGSGKIGFTPAPGGKGYVTGMRGAIERNTMRYYLAIESYLKLPAPQQLNARLERWFDATEQYAEQLHEVDRESYLAMKKLELQRQQASSGGAGT
ncbi:MAG: hypothetical protein Q7T87_09535 [Polaromonas sp.]|nr:hypothetical protein [Polaromonas sp.]